MYVCMYVCTFRATLQLLIRLSAEAREGLLEVGLQATRGVGGDLDAAVCVSYI
jgi:hypothetical protein